MNEDLLAAWLILLADGTAHRKSELPLALDVLQGLLACGVEDRGTALRLPGGLELLEADRIRDLLDAPGSRFVGDIEIFRQIDSTNRHLLALAQSGAEGPIEGRVCLAEMQTSGRGRRGRSWTSPFASNISLSLGVNVEAMPAVEALGLVVGVAVVDALTDVGARGVGLKWPNDVLWQERKLAGILLELARPAEAPPAIIIGVGVNVSIPEYGARDIDQAWVDLETIMGTKVSRNLLAARMLCRLAQAMERFRAEGFAPFKDRWEALHVHRGAEVETRMSEERVAGVAIGVDEHGRLLVDSGGKMVALVGGEVSVRRVQEQ